MMTGVSRHTPAATHQNQSAISLSRPTFNPGLSSPTTGGRFRPPTTGNRFSSPTTGTYMLLRPTALNGSLDLLSTLTPARRAPLEACSRGVVVATNQCRKGHFQTGSTAEKLPASEGLAGGYFADGQTPRPLLARALGYTNAKVEATVNAIKEHGSPAPRDHPVGEARPVAADPSALARIPDGPIMSALTPAGPLRIRPRHRSSPSRSTTTACSSGLATAHRPPRLRQEFLLAHSGTGNDITGASHVRPRGDCRLISALRSRVQKGVRTYNAFRRSQKWERRGGRRACCDPVA